MIDEITTRLFGIDGAVRYVALYDGENLSTSQRADLNDASSSETDRFEELLVNPALLKLATQRGNIDCGGADFLIVGYRHFRQLIMPWGNGHVSLAFELDADPIAKVGAVREAIGEI